MSLFDYKYYWFRVSFSVYSHICFVVQTKFQVKKNRYKKNLNVIYSYLSNSIQLLLDGPKS